MQKLTIDELKDMLVKNKQTKTGTKIQLIERIADGKLLGQIPLCHSCGGGRLRFDRTTVHIKIFREFTHVQDIWKTLILLTAIRSMRKMKSRDPHGNDQDKIIHIDKNSKGNRGRLKEK